MECRPFAEEGSIEGGGNSESTVLGREVDEGFGESSHVASGAYEHGIERFIRLLKLCEREVVKYLFVGDLGRGGRAVAEEFCHG